MTCCAEAFLLCIRVRTAAHMCLGVGVNPLVAGARRATRGAPASPPMPAASAAADGSRGAAGAPVPHDCRLSGLQLHRNAALSRAVAWWCGSGRGPTNRLPTLLESTQDATVLVSACDHTPFCSASLTAKREIWTQKGGRSASQDL